MAGWVAMSTSTLHRPPVISDGPKPEVRPEVRRPARNTPQHRQQLWLRLNFAALILAVLPTTLRVVGSLLHNDSWEYSATEWLINGHGGTTRRGLSGDLLMAAPWISDGTAVVATVMTLLLAVTVGFAMLIGRAIRLSGSPWPLVFWLLPGGLIMGTLQASLHNRPGMPTDFAMRKDYLFLAILLGVVIACVRWPSRRAWPWIALTSAVACSLGVFVHEGLAYFACGLTAYYLLWRHPDPPPRTLWLDPAKHLPEAWRARVARVLRPLSVPLTQETSVRAAVPVPTLLLLVAPCLIALGTVIAITAGSTPDYAAAWAAVDERTRAWLSLEDPTVLWDGLPASFTWLRQGPTAGLRWLDQVYLSSGAWLAWLLTAVLVAGWMALAVAVASNGRPAWHGLRVTAVTVALLALPLFVIAIDWGRWLVLVGLSVSIITLADVQSGRRADPLAPLSPLKSAATVALVVVTVLVAIPIMGSDFPLGDLFN